MDRRFTRAVVIMAMACTGNAWAAAVAPLRTTPSACDATPVQIPAAKAVIPVRLEANHILVNVCVAGESLEFVLDTGAGQTFIDLTTAQRLRLSLGASFTVGGVGAGTIGGASVTGGVLSIPGLAGTQRIGGALDLPRGPGGRKASDGILGFDFLSTRVVALDYAASRLAVYDPATFRYTGDGSPLPLTFVERHPYVSGAVRFADGEVMPGRFIIDVGASGALAFPAPFVDEHHLRERVGPTLRRPAGRGVGGETVAVFGRVAGLRLGTLELVDVIAGLHENSAGALGRRQIWIANIGGEILRRFTVYLDYPRARMILEPNQAFSERFEMDMSGLGLAMTAAGGTTVAFVVPGTPAAEAGFERGDVIVAVDGTAAGDRSAEELRERCRRPGERITLSVRRDGNARTLTLVTRRLI